MSATTRVVLAGSAALLCLAPPANAQSWTTQQEAVMEVIDATWSAENQDTWLGEYTHPEVLGWGNTNPTPRGRDTIQRWIDHDMETTTTLMHSLAPLGIIIRGNTAVAHYYSSWSVEDQEGKRTTTTSRCTDTLTREGTRWLYLGWFCMDEPNEGS